MSAKSIHGHDSISEIAGRLAARRARYDLASVAQRVLYDPAKAAADQVRTVWCHRAIKNESGKGHIWRRLDGSSARLSGVVTCGSVWTCPVCSARVAEKRREELERAMLFHCSAGGRVYLLTLTAPHERETRLGDFERQFAKALQRFKNSRVFKDFSREYQRAGSVRSLEVTWGAEHGFHVHTHDLIFAAPGLERDGAMIDKLRGAWITATIKTGLASRAQWSDMWAHALDLRGGDAASEYVTKFGHDAAWGITAEVTRAHAKAGMRSICGRDNHVTPFQMLAWAQAGDAEAAAVFREFAGVFTGKRMLYWSPHLKSKMGVDDKEDSEVAADDAGRPEEREVAEFDAPALALVISRRALGELCEYVCLLSDGDPEHVQACVDDFLAELRTRPPLSRGTVRQAYRGEAKFYEVEPA